MNTETNKKLVQDDDCHWYLINAEDQGKFYKLLDAGEDGENEFIKLFDKCMVDGTHSVKIKDYEIE